MNAWVAEHRALLDAHLQQAGRTDVLALGAEVAEHEAAAAALEEEADAPVELAIDEILALTHSPAPSVREAVVYYLGAGTAPASGRAAEEVGPGAPEPAGLVSGEGSQLAADAAAPDSVGASGLGQPGPTAPRDPVGPLGPSEDRNGQWRLRL